MVTAAHATINAMSIRTNVRVIMCVMAIHVLAITHAMGIRDVLVIILAMGISVPAIILVIALVTAVINTTLDGAVAAMILVMVTRVVPAKTLAMDIRDVRVMRHVMAIHRAHAIILATIKELQGADVTHSAIIIHHVHVTLCVTNNLRHTLGQPSH